MRNGWYERSFLVNWKRARAPVYRKLCKRCRVTFSFIPLFAMCGWRYPRSLVAAWLWAVLQGASCRDRGFLVAQQVPMTAPDRQSWSDHLDYQRTRPGYQLLARWTRRLVDQARRVLPALAAAAVFLRADPRSVAQDVLGLSLPHGLMPLGLALRLLQELHRSPSPEPVVSLEFLCSELLGLLERQVLPPSHGVRRASGDRVRYDCLVT